MMTEKLTAEIERLRAELAAMRNQEPVAWVHESGDIRFILSPDEITTEQIALNSWKPLIYAELAAGAQPAPSVPEVTDAAQDLLAACKEFVRKVEAGEARSVRSYAQMKAAIAKAENAQPEPDANCITLPDGSCVGGLMAGKQPCMHDRPSGAQPAPSVPDSGRLTPFNSLNAASNAAPEAPKPAPSVPDVDSIVDLMSEFATHDIERGQMEFDKWTLREAVEAALAAAPEAPKLKPLTVDGLLDLFHERQGEWWKIDFGYFSTVARAVEAAHGIKE